MSSRRLRLPLSGRRFVPLVAAVWLVAAPASAEVSLAPVPHPRASAYEPGIRARLELLISGLDQPAGAPADSARLATAYGTLGNLYLARQARAAAEACYRNAIALAPEDFQWRYFLGYLLDTGERPAEAATVYAAALELAPDYLPAAVRLARALGRAGDIPESTAQLRRVLQIDPANAVALSLLAEQAAVRGEFDEAISYYDRALEAQPAADALHYGLAVAWQKIGDTARAREHIRLRGSGEPNLNDPVLEGMLAAQPAGSREHIDAGNEAAAAGRLAEGLRHFEAAVEVNPGSVEAREALGRAYFGLGRLADAQAQFEQAAAQEPQTSVGNFFLGLLAEGAGDDAGAIPRYRNALAGSESVSARLYLANALMRERGYQQAADHYAYLARQRPDDMRPLYWQAMALIGSGRCRQAGPLLDQAMAISPRSALAMEARARVGATCLADDPREVSQALEYARLLQQSRPGGRYAATLAMALAADGQFDEAVIAQRAAAAGAEQDAETRALGDNLAAYKDQRTAPAPWPPGHPRLSPPATRAVGDTVPRPGV